MVSIANGDRAALADLYDRYSARLLGFARWLGLRDSDAEDIVHDVFLEVWHAAGDYDATRASVETWISVRLRSRVLDYWRRPANSRTSATGDVESLAPSVDGMVHVDRELLIANGLSRLTPCQRQVVILAFMEGFSYDEISQQLSIPFGTVKSRLQSALAKLREDTRGGA